MRTSLVSAFLCLPLCLGCISFERDVVFTETPRQVVGFENAEAARIFYSSFLRPKLYHSEQTFQYVFPFLVRIRWNLHETEFYNHQVRRTDINLDGQITEVEANAMLLHIDEEEAAADE